MKKRARASPLGPFGPSSARERDRSRSICGMQQQAAFLRGVPSHLQEIKVQKEDIGAAVENGITGEGLQVGCLLLVSNLLLACDCVRYLATL